MLFGYSLTVVDDGVIDATRFYYSSGLLIPAPQLKLMYRLIRLQCSGKYLIDRGYPSKVKTDLLKKGGYSKLGKWVEDIPETVIFQVLRPTLYDQHSMTNTL